MTEAIAPQSPRALNELPDGVIEVVNRTLGSQTGRIVVKQDPLAERIAKEMGCSAADVFKNNWLDFEDHYRTKGWYVFYSSSDKEFIFKDGTVE